MTNTEDDEILKMLHFVPQVGEIFDVKEKIGEGTFSKVYRAIVKGTGVKKEYALKYLVPTSKPARIATELQCLKDVGGSCNVIGVEFCFMNNGHVVIVMPYYPHQRFSDYVRLLSVSDIREYMRNLLIALRKIHSHGIIHRDVKPNNFLYNQYLKSYTLVDFGLAEKANDLHSRYAVNRQPLSDSSGRLNKDVHIGAEEIQSFQTISPEAVASLVNATKHPVAHNENASKKRKLSSSIVPAMNESLPLPDNNFIAPAQPRIQFQPHLKPKDSKGKSKIRECGCFRKPTVCKICTGRETENAPRGGTAGFRAPEVLLKHRQQTTAIDVWSAGVIMLCILSKKYPFFRADDDLTALAEITFLVGTTEIKVAAHSIGKFLTMNLPETTESISDIRKQLGPARYLQALCTLIMQDQPCYAHTYPQAKEPIMRCVLCYEMSRQVPQSAFDLLNKLLDPNPHTRTTAHDALMHPFFTEQI
ncbi:Cell division cycle 7-related protein kinase [Araneus ventricosus]|uniref:non-specific serine/threonine protein kinase n=1 Tax=Araneus ventricosus TaxID=182803 RepID=A0A4Y2PFC2_ARAVE|nr:Cell division cycle 7-related protein kinase [Araneus ventricosus]GBN48138.1 Cell division cycle 7-related protein kinase [Araneus ventricosus]GBN49909.1 Cell division cycle 7-related protein kinase [Araneus ventricosus]GBN49911.1 Cell division cycle 7-related protein kinase [Araneus ventricosus]